MVLRIAPPDYSGAGRQAHRIAQELRRQGQDVVLLAGSSRRKRPRREEFEGVPVHRWPVLGSHRVRQIMMSAAVAVHLLLRPRRYRVVHLHGTAYLLIVLSWLKRVLGFRLIYKPTSVGRDDATAVLQQYGPAAVSAVDRWVAIAEAVAEAAAEAGVPKSRVVRLSNAVDMETFRPLGDDVRADARAELGIAPDQRLWISVGAIVRGKRFDMLIDAWSRLESERETLLIVGPAAFDGSGGTTSQEGNTHARELRKMIENLGLGDRVRLLGPRSDVQRLMAAADGFVFGSEREGMPNAVLEALAAGLPVISTPIAAAEDLRRAAGERIAFVDPAPAAIAEAVASLEPPPRAVPPEMPALHDLTILAGRYRSLYAELGARSRPAPRET